MCPASSESIYHSCTKFSLFSSGEKLTTKSENALIVKSALAKKPLQQVHVGGVKFAEELLEAPLPVLRGSGDL